MLKQALKGSGPNLTASHMVDMSLCALFLLDTSRRVDEQLRVHEKSSHHTTRDADKDITKMASYLVKEKAESVELEQNMKIPSKREQIRLGVDIQTSI